MAEDSFDIRVLTARAHRVLQLAFRRAMAADRDCVNSEHLLAGLLEEGSGLAMALIASMGVDIHELSGRLEEFVGSGDSDALVDRKLPLAPDTENALKLSLDEARRMGSMVVGTEHLLLGLLRDSDHLGGELLVQHGLAADKVREQLYAMLKEGQKMPNQTDEPAPQMEIHPPEPEPRDNRTGLEGFTRRALRAVEMAREEAQKADRYHIGTDHLLLGILADNRSAAVKTLREHVDDIDKLRDELRSLSRLF